MISTAETTEPKNAQALEVLHGLCHVFFAFDVGLSIDLTQAAKLLSEAPEQIRFRRDQKAPLYFNYDPLPLSISQRSENIEIQNTRFKTGGRVSLTLFDFGAVSLSYSIDISGPFSDLVPLANALYENQALLTDARNRVRSFTSQAAPAIQRADLSELYDDYFVFQITRFKSELDLSRFTADHAQALGQILRCERDRLSIDELSEALSSRLSYGPDDLAVLDWNGAVIIGSSSDDVRTVCEFCNLELLEMRYLDGQLDQSLDQAYQAMIKNKRSRADLRQVAQLQVDGAMLFESVNNALKLLGDQYLARMYSQLSCRLHLPEWDQSILRKLDTLDSIYQKIADQRSQRRAEVLEWIIILLIAFEIVLSVLGFQNK